MNKRPGITQPLVAPVQDASSKQQTKRKYKPNHQQTGLPPHSAFPIRGKTNIGTKTQHKSHPIQSSHKPLDQPEEQKPKGRKNSTFNSTFLQAWEKETSNTITKQIMKRQRNTKQVKERTSNTEVQINEEEIGKLPEKEFRIMIIKMIKNLENKMEKM